MYPPTPPRGGPQVPWAPPRKREMNLRRELLRKLATMRALDEQYEQEGRIIYALHPEQRREREQQREAERRQREAAEQLDAELHEASRRRERVSTQQREAEQRFAESERLRTEHREAQRRALADQYEREEAEREAAERREREAEEQGRIIYALHPEQRLEQRREREQQREAERRTLPRPSLQPPPILQSEEEQRFLDFVQSLPRAPTHRPVITPEMASSMRKANRLYSRGLARQQERESQNRLRMLRREAEREVRRILQSSASPRRENDDEKCRIGPCSLMYGAKNRRRSTKKRRSAKKRRSTKKRR